ncbi:PhzF family phenazine biosynthesis protein [Vibrio cholerae]|nr:PhzF family phenazine biosynthesis protein [Vibrio cholerae]MVB24231.1 PhzF family phenazine biosynthesis protein [Vibrio cholerae]MVB33575.1 PhzF family phenazine biosynthesis protein [Vibrio cholerae]MVB44637.1 PhzF family phenazine biosynthesis protein [Vibrio cholerae]MVB48406.1 PhzF family phenazine biosynthesis protein [Vibrio cholerae]
MAVSETAFLSLSTMQLRWFTPEIEVSLCGHGTLAVAHILKEQGVIKRVMFLSLKLYLAF